MASRKVKNTGNWQLILISAAVFLACITPRFTGFMKFNIGFYMSFYSLVVIITFLLWAAGNKIRLCGHYGVLFMLLLLLATVSSVVATIDYVGWMQYLFYITICELFMILLLQHNIGRMYELIVISISGALLFQVVIGLYEVWSHSYLFKVGDFSRNLYGKVPVSGFYNPNDYSVFIATMLPLVLYGCLYAKNKLKKMLYGVVSVCAGYLLIKTMSRAVVLAMLASLVIFLLLLLKKRRYKGWVLLIFCAGLLSYLIIPSINTWVNRLILQNSIDVTSTSDFYRINLIKNGFYFLSETHGLGVGAGSLKRWFEHRAIYSTGGILYMHNWYIEILVTFGVCIFILYLIFHAQIFLFLYKKIKVRDNEFGLTAAFLISFLIFSVTGISSSSNVYSEWVWMYLAIIVSYVTYCRKNKTDLAVCVQSRIL